MMRLTWHSVETRDLRDTIEEASELVEELRVLPVVRLEKRLEGLLGEPAPAVLLESFEIEFLDSSAPRSEKSNEQRSTSLKASLALCTSGMLWNRKGSDDSRDRRSSIDRDERSIVTDSSRRCRRSSTAKRGLVCQEMVPRGIMIALACCLYFLLDDGVEY